MRFLDGKSIGILSVALALGMANTGCGDDDSGPTDGGPDGSIDGSFAGNGGGDGGGSGGNGPKDGGKDGSVTTGGSGGRTTGGTGGTGAFTPPTCDPDVPTTATCGGADCPASTSQFASFICSVPCCLPDDTCGFRRAIMDEVTDCAPKGVEDPSCPEYMPPVPDGGMMMMTPPDAGDAGRQNIPCCAPSGHCGIISGIDMTCITKSRILTSLMPGPACGDGNDGGTNDGGS